MKVGCLSSLLGFDPLDGMICEQEFARLLLLRSGTIKGALLDQALLPALSVFLPRLFLAADYLRLQSFSAGVGNWVADEVLYQARIHPETQCSRMSAAQVRLAAGPAQGRDVGA